MALLFCLAAFVVLVFGGLGVWTRVLSQRAERRFPPLGQYVVVENTRLHYVERGPMDRTTGSVPIVLIHGAFSALQDYTGTIFSDLAKTHRVLAFDRPGHGYSERPSPPWVGTPSAQAALIHDAVVALGVVRPLVVGFSWGGTVALAFALQYPHDTGALVLLAAPSHPWPDPIEREYFIPTWPLLGPLLVQTIVAPVGHLLSPRSVKRAFYPLPVSPAFTESPYPLSIRPDSFTANAEDLRVLKESVREMSPHYGELKMPITLVHGTLDHTVGLKTHSEPLHAQIPESELIRIPGAGHQLLFTHTRLVIETIDGVATRNRREAQTRRERSAGAGSN